MTTERDAQPSLRGTQVQLRPWTVADADDVFSACQDPEIQRWTTVPSPYTRADAVGYVTDMVRDAWNQGGAVFAVLDPDTARPVGSIGAHGMTDGVAHLGYWTAPAARGRGWTSDALRTVTSWFLEERAAARVELVVEPMNTASIRVAEAAGFLREGLLRQRMVIRGRRADTVMYSRLPGDHSRPR